MTTIYLVRHAEAEGNLYRRVHGWYNSLITENGYRQIRALEEHFRDIPVDAVYSSDLFRTMTTAQAVCGPRGLPLHTDPGLRELNLGDWEDLPFGEVRCRFPQAMDLFNRTDPAWEVPNGETFFQLGDRLDETVRRIARRHPGQTIALFSHGMAIRQFIARVKDIPPEQWHAVPHGDNTAVSCLIWDGERFSIRLEMDNSHLPQEISTLARQAWWRKDRTKAQDVNLWFRPCGRPGDRELYLRLRPGASPDRLPDPGRLSIAMAGDRPMGVILYDRERYAEDGAGYIEFLSILPEDRGRGLGVQLIGEAVSVYRSAGRDRLRLHCPPEIRPFFRTYGFAEAGPELLEKYTGYECKQTESSPA